MPFIALAILGGTLYQANQQRQAANAARDEASRASSIAAQQMQAQVAAQQQQADIARRTLDVQIAKNAEEKSRLEAEAKKAADEIDAERRKMGEAEAARLKSLRRSGSRSLLSDARLNPELGLGGDNAMLGAGVSY
jgi:membrane protein involved in colicin uptake